MTQVRRETQVGYGPGININHTGVALRLEGGAQEAIEQNDAKKLKNFLALMNGFFPSTKKEHTLIT